MKFNPHPSQERLRELFEYRDNNTQPFLWNKNHRNNIKIGDVAGGIHAASGYYRVAINKKQYKLHRLVWIYHNGDIPNGMFVDHIDGDPSNNRIENLRLATNEQNLRNSKISPKNTSGVKGVSWDKSRKKWKAQIRTNYKIKSVGRFDTIEEAEAAIIIARNNLHGDFARHE